MPASLVNRPTLYTDLLPVARAFLILNRSRPVGFGVGAIPLAEIKAWLDIHPVDDTERFIDLIAATDAAYMAAVEDRRKRNANG